MSTTLNSSSAKSVAALFCKTRTLLNFSEKPLLKLQCHSFWDFQAGHEAHPIDPGALLCCSENFNEPKHYNRKNARGEKLSSLANKESGKLLTNTPIDFTSSFDSDTSSGQIEEFPSAINEEEFTQTKGEFLDRLENSGAVDILKISLPSTDEMQSISRVNAKFMSLNMLQMIETLINVNPEKHLKKTSWKRDSLIELIEVIENAEKLISNKEKNSNEELQKDSRKVLDVLALPDEQEKNTVPSTDTLVKESRGNDNIPPLENVRGNDLLEENRFNTPSKAVTGSSPQHNRYVRRKNSTINSTNNSSVKPISQEVVENISDELVNDSENTFDKNKKDTNLFETVLQLQFKTVKNTVLLEADFLSLHLNKCYESLELSRTLIELTNDNDLRTQFLAEREEAMTLALELKRSLKETQNFLNSKVTADIASLELFKRLLEIIVDGKTVNRFIEKYQIYIKIAMKLIGIGKEKFAHVESNVGNIIQKDRVITDIDSNESEEINSSYNNEDESKNIFEENSWKADDSSYQVDDRERVSPVSKMDAGPLFTDKLRLKTESVIGLFPTSLVSSEIPFNSQTLLERIRDNPKYYRNASWTAQYNLLTCMPQPYLNRIMLSGEFYND